MRYTPLLEFLSSVTPGHPPPTTTTVNFSLGTEQRARDVALSHFDGFMLTVSQYVPRFRIRVSLIGTDSRRNGAETGAFFMCEGNDKNKNNNNNVAPV